MQRAIKHFLQTFALQTVEELYVYFKKEILSSPGEYYPNPLAEFVCVHIANDDHADQPVLVNGTLDLIEGVELYSTCYPRTETGTIDWSEPLYVELKDLRICPANSPRCHCVQPANNNNQQQKPPQEQYLTLWMGEVDEVDDRHPHINRRLNLYWRDNVDDTEGGSEK
ncbi:hypothetical protein niasHT_026349 [Heterodera trifolii]|uniref:Uncharacterized protein n=1 Tax=Heterodera trifolii TaxID=157864 RepID=A0ABD2K121_9BILA